MIKFDRKQGIGGSDATRLYEGSWHELWQEKTGATEPADFREETLGRRLKARD